MIDSAALSSLIGVDGVLTSSMVEDYLVSLKESLVFLEKNAFLSSRFEEVSPLQFYSEIFPADLMERPGHPEDGKPNPIITVQHYNQETNKNYHQNLVVFSDYSAVQQVQNENFAVCSLCTFSGRRKDAKHAYKLHGFAIDLDGVGTAELEGLTLGIENDTIPSPSYIVNSGHGLHIYYIFFEPIPLYPRVVPVLQRLKRGLTYVLWNKETSNYKPQDRQFQGIYQGFRVVGSRTKFGWMDKKYVVTAFKSGKPVDLAYLNHFMDEEHCLPEGFDAYGSGYWDEEHLTLEKAKELYPEWYERRIVQGLPPGRYVCSPKLYDWWKKKISDKRYTVGIAKDGNRYWCIAFLFVYGMKCGIDFEVVWKDAVDLLIFFDRMTNKPNNHFTIDDIRAASEYYDEQYVRVTARYIELKTQSRFLPPADPDKKSKKNDSEKKRRTRKEVLEDARKKQKTNWREGNGRKPKKDAVVKWKREHPGGKKADCIRELGLSKQTVYKWWGDVTTAESQVLEWQQLHPDGKKADCIRETGLSKPTVYKWWK